ncbi:MAG: hypothetical protein QG657_1596 [Acidobacteriota bacterium]|nr:hypothetical protein [Acidobacteriota bacterium]
MKYLKKISVLLVFGLIFTSCASDPGFSHRNTDKDIPIGELAYLLNDSLRRPALKNQEIGILTFANLNNLEEAEPLGRRLQERLAHALFELGFRIVEIRIGKDIRFRPLVGELNLKRVQELLKDSEFAGLKLLVVGTYIDAGDYIYVNGRIVELETAQVKASGEVKIEKGRYLAKLLEIEDEKSADRSDVYERFPDRPDKK